eukprot:8765657-Lingulodinium_polyedra.AAC.1
MRPGLYWVDQVGRSMHVPGPMSWHAALAINARACVLACTFGHSDYTPCRGSMLGLASWHAGLATLIPVSI